METDRKGSTADSGLKERDWEALKQEEEEEPLRVRFHIIRNARI